MDGTVLDAAGKAVPASETTRPSGAQVLRPVVGLLRGAWWFSLGTVAIAGEQGGRLFKALVDKGREVEPKVAAPLKKAEDNVSEALGGVGTRIKEMASKPLGRAAEGGEAATDERIAAAVQAAGAPLLEQVKDLVGKVDELTRRIESLQVKREKGGHDRAGQ